MDTLGIEPRAFHMRSGCDTTTPCAPGAPASLIFGVDICTRAGTGGRYINFAAWKLHSFQALDAICQVGYHLLQKALLRRLLLAASSVPQGFYP